MHPGGRTIYFPTRELGWTPIPERSYLAAVCLRGLHGSSRARAGAGFPCGCLAGRIRAHEDDRPSSRLGQVHPCTIPIQASGDLRLPAQV